MRKSKNRYFYNIFVSPGDAPVAITQNVAWMKRQFSSCQSPRSVYPSISSTVSQLFEPQVQKIAVFTYRSPIFVSPGDVPAIITQYVAWMGRQFNACQTPRSMYLSIFNSFRVIRCFSQCVSPKIAIFTTLIFCFPGDAPGTITLNVVWVEREVDAYKLSRCMCPSNYYRFWDTARYLWKSRHFIIPPLHSTPPLGESRRNIGTPLGRKN